MQCCIRFVALRPFLKINIIGPCRLPRKVACSIAMAGHQTGETPLSTSSLGRSPKARIPGHKYWPNDRSIHFGKYPWTFSERIIPYSHTHQSINTYQLLNLFISVIMGSAMIPSAIMVKWPPPNYINPSTRVLAVDVVMLTFTAIMIPFLVARIYMRRNVKRGFGTDDSIIITAGVRQLTPHQPILLQFLMSYWLSILSIVSMILAICTTKWGNGYHIYDVKPEWVSNYKKVWDATETPSTDIR